MVSTMIAAVSLKYEGIVPEKRDFLFGI